MKKFWLFTLLTFIFSVSFIKAAYIDEYPEAYKWAYKNWITTQKTIEKADMEWQITRIALSKMISNYATNVLKKKVDTSKKCQFSDISDKLNSDYDNWATKACQLWLMWQWITKFRPYDKVTRAEFGTILSRLLYWNKHNGWTPYYIRHINNLNIRWIMTNIINAEKVNESRGNVMVMLKRSEELWDYKTPTFEELDDTAFQCPYCALGGCDFENLWKRAFMIPYKDWYIWYDWHNDDLIYGGAGIWDYTYWLFITYRKLDNPCEITSSTDIIYHYHDAYFDRFGCNFYYWNTQKRLETFNSIEKNESKCRNEFERYFYNLITRKEKEEYFTLWIKVFLKDISSGIYYNLENWKSKLEKCVKNNSWEKNKNYDIDEFINNFDAEKFQEEIEKSNLEEEKNRIICIDKFLKD